MNQSTPEKMMLLIRSILVGVSILFGLNALDAASLPQLYQIEVIAFKQVNGTELNSERWPAHPALPDLQQSRPLPPAIDPPDVYQALPPALWQLSSFDTKLSGKTDTELMLHTAWLQPGLPLAKALPVQLVATMINESSIPSSTAEESDQPLVKLVTPIGLAEGSDWQLNGYMRVSKPYLFQVDLNLVLTLSPDLIKKYSPKAAEELQTNQFVLAQTVRMKLNEVYYIDHPLFGVLIEITKYKA